VHLHITNHNRRLEWLGMLALLLAWVGIWGAWIPHQAVSLTQNAIDFAEWSTFLNDVRYGNLSLMPDVLRLAVGLCVIAMAVGAGVFEKLRLRWALRVVGLLPALVLLPPYPDLLKLWFSESYGRRFGVVSVIVVGVALTILTDRLAWKVRRFVIIGASSLAVISGLWAFLTLVKPFQSHYAHTIYPGWGAIVFFAGLLIAAIVQIVDQFREEK
jgi:hypothetical protein